MKNLVLAILMEAIYQQYLYHGPREVVVGSSSFIFDCWDALCGEEK